MSFKSTRTGRKPYTRPAPRPDINSPWVHDKAPTGPGNGVARTKPAVATTTGAGLATISSKIIVSNLHYEVTPKDLTAIFGQMGTLVRDPHIRYDRSGRSTGTAIISFETPAEATRAKKQFNGILAKGQPMSIEYDTTPPPTRKQRSASVPSLINRIQKPALIERLSRDDSNIKAQSQAASRGGVGPIRSRPIRAARGPKKPKTAEELDKELDAFMGEPEANTAVPAVVGVDGEVAPSLTTASTETTVAVTNGTQDVEMA